MNYHQRHFEIFSKYLTKSEPCIMFKDILVWNKIFCFINRVIIYWESCFNTSLLEPYSWYTSFPSPKTLALNSLRKWSVQKQSPGGPLQEDVLQNFAKFTRKHLCQSLFFNEGLQLYLKIDSGADVLLWIFKNILFIEYQILDNF